jgi:tellurite resistance protein TehA-like permease
MKLDVRTPIGAMFALYGIILVGYGALGDQTVAVKKAGGNANLIWGLALVAFGAVMLGLVFRSRTRDKSAPRT